MDVKKGNNERGQDASDTSPEAYAVQLELLHQMSPAQRIQKTFAWSNQLKRMAMDAIRRRHPDFDEAQVRLKFIELTYGKELAENVKKYQEDQMSG